ncbi:MAG: hypothetical protein QOJ65_1172 [Fimbriimonadaceae bacterium]|jgi:GNAT superfamily N-acetyltransferase|nr:hypothetical protein [Fimbriimonadaceae bacterium]
MDARVEISGDISSVDFERVHSWLTTAYWSPGVSLEMVERAARNSSSVLGAYLDGEQVGYCRIVSDKTTFAWLCDVYVDETARGQGVAQKMVQFALDLPDYQELRRWLLATMDAQSLYERMGFEPLQNAERWMVRGKQRLG